MNSVASPGFWVPLAWMGLTAAISLLWLGLAWLAGWWWATGRRPWAIALLALALVPAVLLPLVGLFGVFL